MVDMLRAWIEFALLLVGTLLLVGRWIGARESAELSGVGKLQVLEKTIDAQMRNLEQSLAQKISGLSEELARHGTRHRELLNNLSTRLDACVTRHEWAMLREQIKIDTEQLRGSIGIITDRLDRLA